MHNDRNVMVCFNPGNTVEIMMIFSVSDTGILEEEKNKHKTYLYLRKSPLSQW